MIVSINNIEYDVPDEIGNLVLDAQFYKIIADGKSPMELFNWLNSIALEIKDIKENLNIVLNKSGLKR